MKMSLSPDQMWYKVASFSITQKLMGTPQGDSMAFQVTLHTSQPHTHAPTCFWALLRTKGIQAQEAVGQAGRRRTLPPPPTPHPLFPTPDHPAC